MQKFISKSSYMAGLDCERKLWQLLWDRDSAAQPVGMSELIMTMGRRFGELAHQLYPQATLIHVDIFNLQKAVEDTKLAIESGAPAILEAGFAHGQCRILADVVERQPDGSWHLIEVKSSTRVKEEHISDLAYQKWVMEQCGYVVTRCSVAHADTNGIWPDIERLFQVEDVTDQVETASVAVPGNVARMLPLAEEGATPPDARACFSKACHECEFKKTACWREINGFTIYDVVHSFKIPALEAMGVLYVTDIPDAYELSLKDESNVSRIKHQSIDIDRQAIQHQLGELQYPIHFLDFESVSVAVPLFDGNHPWEKLAFQYSLHIQEEADGPIQHVEYLHEDDEDPSEAVARGLTNDIGGSGSIVVYHAQMEGSVLEKLRDQFPQYAIELQGMIDRLWDLELIFKHHYRHWKFGSKSSIKIVLPTLIPDLTYQDLDIQEGGSASMAWIEMLETDDPGEKADKASALRKYCERDTWAMVALLDHVRKRIAHH